MCTYHGECFRAPNSKANISVKALSKPPTFEMTLITKKLKLIRLISTLKRSNFAAVLPCINFQYKNPEL